MTLSCHLESTSLNSLDSKSALPLCLSIWKRSCSHAVTSNCKTLTVQKKYMSLMDGWVIKSSSSCGFTRAMRGHTSRGLKHLHFLSVMRKQLRDIFLIVKKIPQIKHQNQQWTDPTNKNCLIEVIPLWHRLTTAPCVY